MTTHSEEKTQPDVEERPNRRKLARSKKHPRPGLGRIRWRLDQFCLETGIVVKQGRWKGIANAEEVFRRTRVSKDILFYVMRYPDTVKGAHFRTLARLCYGLNCQPGDLLEYVGAEQSDSPLSELYKLEPTLDLDPETPE
jgi:DNA-binding Xre family transcriptional regulator